MTLLTRISPWALAILLLVQSIPAAPLKLIFDPVFDDSQVRLDSLRYKNAAGETLSVSRFNALLTDFELQHEDGSWSATATRYGFLDASRRRLQIDLNTPSNTTFSAIRFALGPNPDVNHDDPAQYAADHPLNPVLNRLRWDWQTGYIFLALEGRYRNARQQLRGYVYHYANDWNRLRINLPVRFDGAHPTRIRIRVDLQRLFNAPAPISIARDGEATHSRKDDALAAQLQRNLPAAFSMSDVASLTPQALAVPVTPLYMPKTFEAFPFSFSRTIPPPALPRDNPLTQARVKLGRTLFHDPMLSGDGSLSCASCHIQALAFSDGKTVSTGVAGAQGTRNAMPLFNLAWKDHFFWDGRSPSVRDQVLQPIQNPRELAHDLTSLMTAVRQQEDYTAAFAAAFDPPEPTAEKLSLALEAFLLTLRHAR